MPAKKRNSNAVARKKDVVQITKRVLRSQAEKKAFSWLIYNANASNATWDISSFLGRTGAGNRIEQGLDFTNRIGDKIRLHAIHFTVFIAPAAVMPDGNGSLCRIIVYHNTQANGAVPAGAELFNANTFNELRNQLYRNRLFILKDFTHQMVVTGTNAAANLTSGPEFFGTFSIYPKQEISYSGTSGEITQILKHDYGIGICSDTASCCNVTVKAQVVFTDA